MASILENNELSIPVTPAGYSGVINKLCRVVEIVSMISGGVFAGGFIAGTPLNLIAKIATVALCAQGAFLIARIATNILTNKTHVGDWVFLALAVVGAVIGFFVGGGIPGLILGALAIPGAVYGALSVISTCDRQINAPSMVEIAQSLPREGDWRERGIQICDARIKYTKFQRISRLVHYFDFLSPLIPKRVPSYTS